MKKVIKVVKVEVRLNQVKVEQKDEVEESG